MTPGYERDSLLHFCCQHKKGNKYIHQYHLEEVFPPGNLEPCTVVKRMVENEEGKMVVSRIVTCRDNYLRQLMNGVGEMATWVWRGHGPIAKTHVKMSARNMSGSI
jgi:hypothetical protein